MRKRTYWQILKDHLVSLNKINFESILIDREKIQKLTPTRKSLIV